MKVLFNLHRTVYAGIFKVVDCNFALLQSELQGEKNSKPNTVTKWQTQFF